MGPNCWNSLSFAPYKEKIIPTCSLEIYDFKNIYFSHVIFNIFRRNTPVFLILCEIYQIHFLVLNTKSGGCISRTLIGNNRNISIKQ